MRKPEALDAAAKRKATIARSAFAGLVGKEASVNYVKADNTPRVLVGVIEEVKGEGDKEVVVVKTAEGYRSANLSRVKSVKGL